MNNKIKEILDYLDYGVNSLSISKPPFKIEYEDVKKLLDYITNLQQELEKTEECRDELLEVNDIIRKLKERYKHEKHIYKIRIDKAIEYIKEKYDYILGDDTFLDHDKIIDRKQIIHILELLGDKEVSE